MHDSSRETIMHGCTCSPTLNRHGRGTLHGKPRFYYHRKCPVHRSDAEKFAREAGEVRIARKPSNDEENSPARR